MEVQGKKTGRWFEFSPACDYQHGTVTEIIVAESPTLLKRFELRHVMTEDSAVKSMFSYGATGAALQLVPRNVLYQSLRLDLVSNCKLSTENIRRLLPPDRWNV